MLLVGNSYIYYGDSLHNHLRRMVAAADAELGKKLQYKSATIGGAWLDHHNIDWLTTLIQRGELLGAVSPLMRDGRSAMEALAGGFTTPVAGPRRLR